MDGAQSKTEAGQADISGPIARFAVATEAVSIPESARRIAKLSLLDWSAVALAGTAEPVSKAVRALVGEEGGAPQATVIGHPVKLPARAAALANGATSHALDYDDTHFDHVGHTSVAIYPAALAVAELTDASGAALLEAALIGHETAVRIGTWLGSGHYNFGFHQTATAGTFGAVAAAARLLGLDEATTRHALGIAATRASGLKSQFGTMGKPYHAGMAAANGVEAALLARHGFVSRPDGIECAQGFAATHAGDCRDLERVLQGLGASWRFETVQYKFHACCHGTHAAIEALVSLKDKHRLAPDDIASVTLGVNPRWLKVCNIERPATGLEAKFSYRLTSAMALAGVKTGALEVYSEATCADPALMALADRVRIEADARHRDTAAHVRLATRDGRAFEAAFDLEAPMPAAEKERKLREKAAALIGNERAARLWQAISTLEQGRARDLGALVGR